MSQPDGDAERMRAAMRAILGEKGWNVSDWAREARVSEGTIRQFLSNQTSTMMDRTINKLAHAAKRTSAHVRGEISLDSFGNNEAEKPAPKIEPGSMATPLFYRAHPASVEPPTTPGIPVRGAAPHGDRGAIMLTGRIEDIVPRPAAVQNLANLYVIRAVDNSMAPIWPIGKPIYHSSSLPPEVGRHAIVELHPDNGLLFAWFGILRSLDRKGATVQHISPKRDIHVEARHIAKVWRVLDWWELLPS